MNKLSDNEIQRIREAGNLLGLTDFSIVEKDVFVTLAIHAIADINHPDINLVFCGGTCLAKAHQIVKRMSEDVDFKLFPKIAFNSNSEQRRKLSSFRDEITQQLIIAGFEVNERNVRSRDNNSYTVYYLDYPSHFDQHQELKPQIHLEFTLAEPRLPLAIKSVASLVDRTFPNEKLIEKNINCISILETAAEKWVALTRRIAAIARGHDSLDETLVRHIYDLHAIIGHISLSEDFKKLVTDTIERDRVKFKRHHEYIRNPIDEIEYALDILKNDVTWKQHYNHFVEAMVFGQKTVNFEQCYTTLQTISEYIFNK